MSDNLQFKVAMKKLAQPKDIIIELLSLTAFSVQKKLYRFFN